MAQPRQPAQRRHLADHCAQQRSLAAAVRPHQRHALPAKDLQIRALNQRNWRTTQRVPDRELRTTLINSRLLVLGSWFLVLLNPRSISNYQLLQLQRQITTAHLRAEVHGDLLLLLRRIDARVDPLIIRALIAIFQPVQNLLATARLLGAHAGLEAPDEIFGLINIILLGIEV